MLRRQFLSSSAFTAMGLGIGEPQAVAATPGMSTTFNILQYGAVPDGKTLNTKQIQSAVDEAAKQGGGTVYIPAGTFMTGGIVLRSNVTLYLASSAKLLGSTHVEDYDYNLGPPVDSDANGRHLIFARDCVNIEISGLGTIDGNGPAFWMANGHPEPKPDRQWNYVIANSWSATTTRRPSPMLEFVYCTNVRIKDVTLANAAGWTLRPIACKTVHITGIQVRNPVYGPNTDGMDITCSENVFISNCDIETGDDAICLKSENPYGPILPTRNVIITNCVLTTCCNGFKIGTATHGAFENIVFTDSVIYNKDVPYHYRVLAGIAIETVDGGSIDGVYISNIRMQNVRAPIFIRLGHRNPNPATFMRNVSISGVDAVGAILTSSITGMQDAFVDTVTLSDIRIRTEEAGQKSWGRPEVPEHENSYPEIRMFGRLPAYGFYIRHARNLRLKNIEIICDKDDFRPAIVCNDVKDVVVSGFETRCPVPLDTIFELKNCHGVFIQGARTPKDTNVFARIVGPSSGQITLFSNELGQAKDAYAFSDGASQENVSVR